MKNYIFIFCLFSIYAFSGQAQHHLSWKVTSKNGKQLYILPDLPLNKKDSIPVNYTEIYKKADVFIFEFNPDSLTAEYQQLYVNKGFYKADDHLKNHLRKKDFKNLGERLEELGLALGHHPRMKPWLISLTLNQLEKEEADFSTMLSSSFYTKAISEKKSTFYLNTTNSLQALLAQQHENKQEKHLLKHLKNSSKHTKLLKKIQRSSNFEQDISKLAELFLAQLDKNIQKEFLENAQEKRIYQLEKLSTNYDNPVVILNPIVLFGKRGLLQILAKQQWKIEKL